MNEREIKVIPKAEVRREPPHRLYLAFTNAKSVMIELARTIASESPTVPPDVKRILDKCAKDTA